MTASIRWEGLETWEALTDPKKFKDVLSKQVRKANRRLAPKMISKVRRDIRAKSYTRNALLTKLLKGSAMPLVDNADLLNAINARHVSDWEFHVGVIREDEKGNPIALILHEGATIKVTPQMRAWFRARAADTDGLVKPLKSSTKEIRIPPRPFIKHSFVDDAGPVKVLVEWEWGEAVRRTIEIIGRRYGKK